MYRTHLAFALFLACLVAPFVIHLWIFFPVVLVSSFLPDIDSMHSYVGHRKIFRPLQWIVQHRSVLHSFTFCFLVSLGLALYFPVIALPFFLGYTSHLFGDALTLEGIRPFWPKKDSISGKVLTGGKFEMIIFFSLIVVDLIFVYLLVQ